MMTRTHSNPRRGRQETGLLAAALAGTMLVSGCAGGDSPGNPVGSSGSPAAGAYVDTYEPTFTDPTRITNPLFPVEPGQTIQLGREGGSALRNEITMLADTRTIDVAGHQVEAVVSQFVGYSDGRIAEVAVDFFAQDDAGGVWYLGEEVDNYRRGVVVDHEGSWLAGRDGPPGLIMPADPKPGDRYRPENMPGSVFEDVTVKEVGLTVAGPLGPVTGTILVQEHAWGSAAERKHFAPGYGEFTAHVPEESEVMRTVISTPQDYLDDKVPAELVAIAAGAAAVDRAAAGGRWGRVTALVERMTTQWETYAPGEAFPALQRHVEDGLTRLRADADRQAATATRQSALAVGMTSLDLQLAHRTQTEIDALRLELLRRHLALARHSGDRAAMASDRATIAAIRGRT